MKKKLAFIIFIMVCIIFVFSGCSDPYVQKDFHIKSYEMWQEYYPKYLKTAETTVKKHVDIPYELTEDERKYETYVGIFHNKLQITYYNNFCFRFEDGTDLTLQLSFYELSDSYYSYFHLYLSRNINSAEDIEKELKSVRDNYCIIMDEIIIFMDYNTKGDLVVSDLYSKALTQAKDNNFESGLAELQYAPYDWMKYKVYIYKGNEEIYYLNVSFGGTLSDLNVYECN